MSPFGLNMDGCLIIDKPAAVTSHDVVARVRRAIGIRRVGHTGTLDPFATGVLVVCVGRATRLARFITGLDKEYLACIRFGFATDTQDVTGKQITPLITSNELTASRLRQAFEEFLGPQMQVPPMYSARKVAGERLYRAARAGREVERTPSAVTIYSIDPITPGGPELSAGLDGTLDCWVRVRCSSGTYVRTLADDIGRTIGVGGHLGSLRRTAVGPFDIDRAVALERIENESGSGGVPPGFLSPSESVGHMPMITLDESALRLVRIGRQVELPGPRETCGVESDLVRLCDSSGRLIAVAERHRGGLLKPRVVLS